MSLAFGRTPCPQVNHLSHFLLTLELLPIILETASTSGDGRIVFVSSTLHNSADWNPTAPLNLSQQEYDSFSRLKAYNNSKLYNVRLHIAMFCSELWSVINL